MRMSRFLFRTFLSSSLFLCSWALAGAQNLTSTGDNTQLNQRDRNTREPVADRQKDARADQRTTRKIRQALTQAKSLSTYGHNVKIVTQNGLVTLKGPVRSEEEKKAVVAKATELAGDNQVTSKLDVKPEN